MFDSHKGHTVSKIEEGAKELRKKINNSAKEGIHEIIKDSWNSIGQRMCF